MGSPRRTSPAGCARALGSAFRNPSFGRVMSRLRRPAAIYKRGNGQQREYREVSGPMSELSFHNPKSLRLPHRREFRESQRERLCQHESEPGFTQRCCVIPEIARNPTWQNCQTNFGAVNTRRSSQAEKGWLQAGATVIACFPNNRLFPFTICVFHKLC